jgi:inner membrane protein
MQKSLVFKAAIVALLCLLSLIPLAMVRDVIEERCQLRDQVIQSIARETVSSQIIKGPVLVVPYRKRVVETEIVRRGGEPIEVKREKFTDGKLWFLPEELTIDGQARPAERRRGLYRVPTYNGDWLLTGRFVLPARFGIQGGVESYTWGKAELAFGIADPRGLAPGLSLAWDGVPVQVEAGSSVPGIGRGVHARVDVRPSEGNPRSIAFTLRIGLTGQTQIAFLPAGRISTVKLASSWPHPGFFGPQLADHEINATGFRASWRSSFLANNLPREYGECFQHGRCENFDSLAFGVSLVQPVNLYQRLERSVKYGLLFVGLTFACFYFVDALKQRQIHPIQYGLVGAALVIFYLLLTSLSEHMAFAAAYAIAASACALLIGYYAGHVLGGMRRGAALSALLGGLYAVLFAILRSEDNALLMGALLLFVALASVMTITRRVDWYRLGPAASVAGDS